MAAKVRTEFLVAVPHKPGALAGVLESLAKSGVNVLAFCGWGEGENAKILVVPDKDDKARKVLGGATETRVLCVTTASGKGAGAKLSARLAKAGINVEHAYATTSGTGQGTAVFQIADADAALKALK
jgi:hypothetical protein